MIGIREEIRRIHEILFEDFLKKQHKYVYRLFEIHNDAHINNRNYYVFEIIKKNFSDLKKVVIINSSNPIPLCHFFKSEYDSDITLISDHPSFEFTQKFFSDFFKTNNIIKSAFFDDLSDDIKGADLVIFPEFEYMVPLDMLKYYNKGTMTMAVHHIAHVNDHNSRMMIMTEHDLLEECNFDEVIDSGRTKNSDGRNIFYSLGIR